MKYRAKPEEVEAIELSEAIILNGMEGAKGDFLVHGQDGSLSISQRGPFLKKYEPYALIIDSPAMKVIAPTQDPDENLLAKIKAENEQTHELCCFTCHADVKASEVDEDKNCPKCAAKKQPKEYDKKSLIGLCEECGSPAFPESLKDGVCHSCRGGK